MKRTIRLAALVSATLALPAFAQTEEISPEEATQLESLNQQDRSAQAPGEDVMRPTKHGIRMTPGLARAAAGAWISEALEKDIGAFLSPEQKKELTEKVARRIMETGHAYGDRIRPVFEAAVENMGGLGKDISPEKAKDFATKAKETLPVWREFFGHMTEDCRPYLNDEQLKQIEEKQKLIEKGINKFEQRMDRWSKGEVKGGEEPFDGLDKHELEADEEQSKEGKSKKTSEARMAERRATWAMRDLEPNNWLEFLGQVRSTFKLTDEQYARGQAILKDYANKARAVATPQWREKVRRNRMLHSMDNILQKESPAPWLYHLDREYDEMARPVLELRKAFQQEVMGLVTREQREMVINELREFAMKHGMTAEEADIRLTTTQPG